MSLPGIALALLVWSQSEPRQQPPFDEAWTCGARTDVDGVSVHVIRTLDDDGQQLRADAQWFMSTAEPESLSLWGISDLDGAGDPAVFAELLVSAANGQNNPDARSWRVMLHRAGQSPSAAAAVFAFSDAPAGATIPWSRVEALTTRSSPARLSLIDRDGRLIAFREIDQPWLRMLKDRLGTALAETRVRAARYEERCEPVTEWMRL